ncbi:MAG: 2-dehydro-3-deoxygalactonokinase [Candidatus Sulfotelmatobacter sp.]
MRQHDPSNPVDPPAELIALDWGTTSLRAYLLGDEGRALQRRSLPLGLMRVQERTEYVTKRDRAFESALADACGDWMHDMPSVPVLAAGMVGSSQGWKEAPYRTTPLELMQLSRYLTPVQDSNGRTIYLVPGLLQKGALPDVMRGEETQILGALPSINSPDYEQDLLFCLPGTHSKWAHVSRGCIHRFATFMTGEVFSVLRRHSILSKTIRDGSTDLAAFERGASLAATENGRAGVLSNIFSVRTLGLTGALPPEQQADYLSGILIGHEISSMSQVLKSKIFTAGNLDTPIVLIGEDELCLRYSRALKMHGYENIRIAADAMQRGLWKTSLEAFQKNRRPVPRRGDS